MFNNDNFTEHRISIKQLEIHDRKITCHDIENYLNKINDKIKYKRGDLIDLNTYKKYGGLFL